MLLNLKEDAIFIADSHYNKNRKYFENIIDDILTLKIQTKQLFLMGDMFDYLSENIDYFKKINSQVIDKLNQLSNKIEIVYLEGNHDYNLHKLFPNINIVKRENQPLIVQYQDRYVALSHGDIFTPIFYNIFCSIIRNRYILSTINSIDINSFISKWIEKKLISKNICHKLEDFDSFAQDRIEKYKKYDDISFIIEGHYHQDKSYKNYINIPSFACGNLYSTLKIKDRNITLEHLQYN